MKILYFHQHFTTPEGSGGTRSYEFSKNLVSKGHEVTMVCGTYVGGKTGLTDDFKNNVREGCVSGINIIELNIPYSNKDSLLKRSIKFFYFSLKSFSIVLKIDFDILFATSTPLTAAIPGIFSKLIRKGRFIFEVRDLWPELPKAMKVIKNPIILILLDRLETIAYKSSDGLIGLSPGIVEGIKRKTKDKKRLTMIPNGSDLKLFKNNIAYDNDFSAFGISSSDFLAIYTGTHGRANGLQVIVEAAKVLKQRQLSNIKIVLIGDGSEKEILQVTKELYQLENLIFLPPLPKVKLAPWMQRANLGLQILSDIPEFYFGTSPNKFFDYISSSLPVLINYPGWLAELILEYKMGYFADPKQEFDLANKLEEASKNENISKQAVASFELAKKHFDREILSNDFRVFLEEILIDEN